MSIDGAMEGSDEGKSVISENNGLNLQNEDVRKEDKMDGVSTVIQCFG